MIQFPHLQDLFSRLKHLVEISHAGCSTPLTQPLRRSSARRFRSSRPKSYLIPKLTNGNWARTAFRFAVTGCAVVAVLMRATLPLS
jgi:hypothetical protein